MISGQLSAIDLWITIDEWDAEQCITYLEQDGESAPECDLETERGLERLRQECKERAVRAAAA
ncbi:MAG: hypothetical protein OEU36_11225 [Gammaproteobacteria bacterium]|nr:hypothetical protein [Gammaproteobacteria bacterium]